MSERYAALFASEAREHLAGLTDALLALERAPAGGAGAPVDAAFRAVHTIKGMSASMGYRAVERVAHESETVLARVRAGELAPAPALVDALLAASDALGAAVEAAVGAAADPDVSAALAALAPFMTGAGDSHAPAADAASHTATQSEPASPASTGGRDVRGRDVRGRDVRVRIAPEAPLPGVRAYLALGKARALGTVRDVVPDESAFHAPGFDGSFGFQFDGDATTAALEKAIRLAGDVAEVAIVAPRPAAPASALSPDAASPAIEPASGTTSARAASAPVQHVRIDAARLDTLLDLVGELVATRGRLGEAAARVGDAALAAAVADLGRIAATMQEQVLESRLVPVTEVTDRLPRLVRDAARATGKQVELVVEGGDVTVDRGVLDVLAEPLGHLLRNAVDHGLEAPDVRRASGKPETGRLVVRASRERDAVVVEVQDDGRGIDRAAVRARGIERGLVDPSIAHLDDDQLLQVIAAPGLSTAAQVTAVSGRGVGVDAVLAKVRAMGGALALRTADGQGSRFILRLPLTLAIVRALLARVDGATYALPLAHVRETLDLAPGDVVPDDAGRPSVRVRDELVPILPLGDALAGASSPEAAARVARATEAAVLDAGGRRLAVSVDGFAGQPDLVVKRLPRLRGAFRIYGGASILESGAVAPILDVPALLTRLAS